MILLILNLTASTVFYCCFSIFLLYEINKRYKKKEDNKLEDNKEDN